MQCSARICIFRSGPVPYNNKSLLQWMISAMQLQYQCVCIVFPIDSKPSANERELSMKLIDSQLIWNLGFIFGKNKCTYY
jgi:hypothetical protein